MSEKSKESGLKNELGIQLMLIKYALTEFDNTSYLFNNNGVNYLTKFVNNKFVTKKAVCESGLYWEWEN